VGGGSVIMKETLKIFQLEAAAHVFSII